MSNHANSDEENVRDLLAGKKEKKVMSAYVTIAVIDINKPIDKMNVSMEGKGNVGALRGLLKDNELLGRLFVESIIDNATI